MLQQMLQCQWIGIYSKCCSNIIMKCMNSGVMCGDVECIQILKKDRCCNEKGKRSVATMRDKIENRVR
jgi:hypothetical protein